MAQINLTNVSFASSHPALLDNATLHIEPGERIGLVGRNGAGKSTLLKLLNSEITPDNGSLEIASDVVISKLTQDVPEGAGLSSFAMAAKGFGAAADAVETYRRLGLKMQDGTELNAAEQADYENASGQLAELEQWDAADRLEGLLQEMQLPTDAAFDSLSHVRN